jgi:hypothetical protein
MEGMFGNDTDRCVLFLLQQYQMAVQSRAGDTVAALTEARMTSHSDISCRE